MTTHGPEQTFFVVASTDMDRVAVMMTRIREQIEKGVDLKAHGELELSVQPIALPGVGGIESLAQEVQEVADRVTEMARLAPKTEPVSSNGKTVPRRS
jgi:hypothetical protein